VTVTSQRLGKHVRAATNADATIEDRRFLCGPCREVITRTIRARSQLNSAREAEKRWRCNSVDSSVVGYSPDSNDVGTS
jgi:hypothetical protein